MIDERTKSICNKKAKYPNAPTFKEHCEAMMKLNRSLWDRHIAEMKGKGEK